MALMSDTVTTTENLPKSRSVYRAAGAREWA